MSCLTLGGRFLGRILPQISSSGQRRCLRVALSSSSAAALISGSEVSSRIRTNLAREVRKIRETDHPDFRPGLAIVQVGDRSDSNVYIRSKIRAAEEIGIKATHFRLPSSTTQTDLLDKLVELNEDGSVHGIIVQMPLQSSEKIDSHLITDSVLASKDVDGLSTVNEGKLATGDLLSGFIPCTPAGCLELIKQTGIKVEGASAVVIGRSKIVGTPVAELLKWNHATVTVCHSKTRNMKEVVSSADILVVAIGQPTFVPGDWIKSGCVVIDCGINSIPDSTKKSGHRIVGDVNFEEAAQVASYITPVPGGVGPMTVALLMSNVVLSAKRRLAAM